MGQQHVDISFVLNGEERRDTFPAHYSALKVLREIVGVTGVKEGCGIGECGACTIIVNGKAIDSCLMLGAQLDGCTVLTVEGLDKDGELDALQQKLVDKHGVQCGFCTPGVLMSAHAYLKEQEEKDNVPDNEGITKAIAGNLCRCTGYQQIITAIEEVAGNEKREEV